MAGAITWAISDAMLSRHYCQDPWYNEPRIVGVEFAVFLFIAPIATGLHTLRETRPRKNAIAPIIASTLLGIVFVWFAFQVAWLSNGCYD